LKDFVFKNGNFKYEILNFKFALADRRNMAKICVFEDSGYSKLLPLAYVRPVYGLKCGMSTLLEKIERAYKGAEFSLYCRDYLAECLGEEAKKNINRKINDGCLFINGRILMDRPVPAAGKEEIGLRDGVVLYARLNKERSSKLTPDSLLSGGIWATLKKEVKTVNADFTVINNTWDLVNANPGQIAADFRELAGKPAVKGRVYEGACLVNRKQIHIGRGSSIKPGAVLDAEGGPVYIGENAEVSANAVIEGPACVGDGSIIRIGAKIRAGTSIGETCRVGGEVEESIIHGYSNKQHDGFLGHAYLGMWCNIGAGTNNSDLKNNYGRIKVFMDGGFVDSGQMFVGLVMGDHSKCAIGTLFNSGSVVGVSSNIYGGGMPPKFVPSFCWGDTRGLDRYELGKALDTAKTVMGRRNEKMSAAAEKLLRAIYELTEKERKQAIL
jgi:UDP-N-acetylglucosamine diphosphorylase / glucose-1-phosphate thymidylyltransferase / UDP-N-acetylgalactosamine diphosphorylase / glucosamine-1-phosphate N-acetyltransferase / galactosamine-1-phosphate N-acetyltransferase